MVKQIRIIEDKVVLQFYYYRTYINRIPRRRRRARVRKIRRSRYLSSFEINTLLNFQLNKNEEEKGIPRTLSMDTSRLAVSALLVKKEFIPSRFLENRLPIVVNKYRYKKFLSLGGIVRKGLITYWWKTPRKAVKQEKWWRSSKYFRGKKWKNRRFRTD